MDEGSLWWGSHQIWHVQTAWHQSGRPGQVSAQCLLESPRHRRKTCTTFPPVTAVKENISPASLSLLTSSPLSEITKASMFSFILKGIIHEVCWSFYSLPPIRDVWSRRRRQLTHGLKWMAFYLCFSKSPDVGCPRRIGHCMRPHFHSWSHKSFIDGDFGQPSVTIGTVAQAHVCRASTMMNDDQNSWTIVAVRSTVGGKVGGLGRRQKVEGLNPCSDFELCPVDIRSILKSLSRGWVWPLSSYVLRAHIGLGCIDRISSDKRWKAGRWLWTSNSWKWRLWLVKRIAEFESKPSVTELTV